MLREKEYCNPNNSHFMYLFFSFVCDKIDAAQNDFTALFVCYNRYIELNLLYGTELNGDQSNLK